MTPEGINFIIMLSGFLALSSIVYAVVMKTPINRITREEQIQNQLIKTKYDSMPDLKNGGR